MNPAKPLDPETIEALENLIRDNVESSRSLQEAARSKDGSPMAALLREIAQERFAFAADLRRYVRPSPDHESRSHRHSPGLQGWWTTVSYSSQGDNVRALLAAAERAEAEIEADYERILARIEDHPAFDLVREQEHEIRRHHDRIQDLRARSASAIRN